MKNVLRLRTHHHRCFTFSWNNNKKKHHIHRTLAPLLLARCLCVRLKSKTSVVPLIRVDRAAALLFIVKPLYCQTDGNCFDSFALQTFYSLSRLHLDAEHCFCDVDASYTEPCTLWICEAAVSKIESKISTHITTHHRIVCSVWHNCTVNYSKYCLHFTRCWHILHTIWISRLTYDIDVRCTAV